jgi:hypothetical protein
MSDLPPIGVEEANHKLKRRIEVRVPMFQSTCIIPPGFDCTYNVMIKKAFAEVQSKRGVFAAPLITVLEDPSQAYPWQLNIELTHRFNSGTVYHIKNWGLAVAHACNDMPLEYHIILNSEWREQLDAAIEELKSRSEVAELDYVPRHA